MGIRDIDPTGVAPGPALDEEVYLLSHPDDLQYVLQSHPSDFRGLDVPGAQDFGRVVQNSVVSLHEEDREHEETGSWTRRTRILGPEFAERAVASQVPRLVETTLATLAEFEGDDGGVTAGDPATVPAAARVDAPTVDGVHLLPAMRRLTLRLLGVSLFGPDIRAHEVAIIEAVGHLTGAAEAIVERRRRTPRGFEDALGTWLWRRARTPSPRGRPAPAGRPLSTATRSSTRSRTPDASGRRRSGCTRRSRCSAARSTARPRSRAGRSRPVRTS